MSSIVINYCTIFNSIPHKNLCKNKSYFKNWKPKLSKHKSGIILVSLIFLLYFPRNTILFSAFSIFTSNVAYQEKIYIYYHCETCCHCHIGVSTLIKYGMRSWRDFHFLCSASPMLYWRPENSYYFERKY